MALKLADIYNVDKKKTAIAAILHDYYKYEDNDILKKLINKEDIKECEKYPFLYHAYASACALENEFNIIDEDIYNAIRYHVFGRLNMSMLEKIIMISDYTEINREYDDCIYCRKILFEFGINKAIYNYLKLSNLYHEKKGMELHPMQIEILKEYEIYGDAKNNS